jgi:hypothetical protein
VNSNFYFFIGSHFLEIFLYLLYYIREYPQHSVIISPNPVFKGFSRCLHGDKFNISI